MLCNSCQAKRLQQIPSSFLKKRSKHIHATLRYQNALKTVDLANGHFQSAKCFKILSSQEVSVVEVTQTSIINENAVFN